MKARLVLFQLLKNPPSWTEWCRFWAFCRPQSWSECWTWPEHKRQKNGYGVFGWRYKKYRSHRLIMIWLCGALGKLEIDHVWCNNRACCNPLHLIPTTHKCNTLRSNCPSALCARKTHCKDGHPLTGENLYINPANGSRQCRICCKNREAKRIWDDRRRASKLRSLSKPEIKERRRLYMQEYNRTHKRKRA